MIRNILKASDALGHKRPVYPVFTKLIEEIGELSVEVNVLSGFLPLSKGGSDGVLGEGNDVINCVVDLIYLVLKKKNPELTIDQIADMIEQNQEVKCEKWLNKVLFQI